MPRPLILVALAVAACSDVASLPDDAPALRRGCAADTDCPGGLRCASSACVGEVAPGYDLMLRVRPAPGGASGAVEVQDVRFTAGPVLAPARPVVVPDAVTVVRNVATRAGAAVVAEVSARAEVAAVDPAPGATATTVATPDGQRFTLSVAPVWPTLDESLQCVDFRLRVVPERDALPPWEQSGVRFGDCGVPPNVRLPANLPPPEEDGGLRAFCGSPPARERGAGDMHVICGEVRVSRENPTPVAMQVHARDGAGRPVSTRAFTDAAGAFALGLWPDAEARTVTVRVEAVNPRELPLPRIDASIELSPTEEEVPVLHRIYLGDVGRAYAQRGRVTGLRGNDEVPLLGASVRFLGRVGNGTFETSAGTGRDGTFDVNLYDGEYVVDVDPGAGEYRLLRTRVQLNAAGGPLGLTLRPRTPLTGEVVGPDGSPLAGATVGARLLRARYADPTLERDDEAPLPRDDSTLTDEGGRFTLRLDPGDHLLTVRPALDRGLPWLLIRRTVPADQPVDVGRLTVPAAAVASLALIGESGAPLTQAQVEAWAVSRDAEPALVGEGRSDAQGKVVLTVPTGPPPALGAAEP